MSARTVHRVNIAVLQLNHLANVPDGFRPRIARLGKLLGAAITGMSVYELPPGEAIGPYHYEYPEEEWLVVLDGRPTLRHPDGEHPLQPCGRRVLPARARRRARACANDTVETVRLLMFSNISEVAASVYPDSDKVAIWTGHDPDDLIVKRTSGVGYWDGESGATRNHGALEGSFDRGLNGWFELPWSLVLEERGVRTRGELALRPGSRLCAPAAARRSIKGLPRRNARPGSPRPRRSRPRRGSSAARGPSGRESAGAGRRRERAARRDPRSRARRSRPRSPRRGRRSSPPRGRRPRGSSSRRRRGSPRGRAGRASRVDHLDARALPRELARRP